MNPIIFNLLAAGGTAKPTAPASASAAAPAGPDAFGSLLTGTLGRLNAAAAKPADKPAATDSGKLRALEAKIAKLRGSGAAEGEIVSMLAAGLAESVAQQLGLATPDARAQLQAVFAGALAPPGANDAGSTVSDRNHVLAQRFLKLQDLATSIANGTSTGQQKRLAGNFLDAAPAKEHPAQTISTQARADVTPAPGAHAAPPRGVVDHRNAFDAPPATASTAATTAAFAVPAAAFATAPRSDGPGDGRSVKLDSKSAIAAGGDTLLGRVLSRAVLADDARANSNAHATNPTPSAVESAANAASATDGAPATATATSADPALAAFVKSFVAALGTAPADAHAPTHAGPASPVAVPLAAASTSSAAPMVPTVAPFRIESPAPVSAPAPAPVDPSAIADQVLRGISLRTTGASSEMRLSLVPETLGDVNIKLVVTDGSVTAHVLAQTPEVRDALVAAQPQLTKQLADSGLKLTGFTVDLSGNGFTGFSQQQQPPPNGQRQPTADALYDADSDANDAALEAIPSYGPSLLGPAVSADFNHLA